MVARIEGTLLRVCHECASFGETIQIKTTQKPKSPLKTEVKKELMIIVPDYAMKIKIAREKAGLKQDELAKKLQERVTVIQKVEGGETPPDVALAKKIEHFFHITLLASYTEEKVEQGRQEKDGLTIGDILQKKNN